jgi:hypothetical protein
MFQMPKSGQYHKNQPFAVKIFPGRGPEFDVPGQFIFIALNSKVTI